MKKNFGGRAGEGRCGELEEGGMGATRGSVGWVGNLGFNAEIAEAQRRSEEKDKCYAD